MRAMTLYRSAIVKVNTKMNMLSRAVFDWDELRMKVAHILRKWDPREWGGTETVVYQLLEGIRDAGGESVVFCPSLEGDAVEDPLVKAGFRVQRFKAFLPLCGLNEERRRQIISVGGDLMSIELLRALWKEPNVSVLHAHTFGHLGGVARTVARWRKIPLVASVHGGILDVPIAVRESASSRLEGTFHWGKVFGFLLGSRRLLADADVIITLNETEAKLLRERIPTQRIAVLPNGVPCADYHVDHKESAYGAYPEMRGKRVLIVLGRIDPIKNQRWVVEQLPQIFKDFPDAMLVFAGSCTDDAYLQTLKQRIDQLGVRENVLLTGGLPTRDQRLIGLLQLSTILLLPSISETFGIVLLEAWAAGTPVISSRTSGASQLVIHGENGWLFDLERPEHFHETLLRALSNPKTLAKAGQAGCEMVREQYDISKVTGQFLDLYNELAGANRCVT